MSSSRYKASNSPVSFKLTKNVERGVTTTLNVKWAFKNYKHDVRYHCQIIIIHYMIIVYESRGQRNKKVQLDI